LVYSLDQIANKEYMSELKKANKRPSCFSLLSKTIPGFERDLGLRTGCFPYTLFNLAVALILSVCLNLSDGVEYSAGYDYYYVLGATAAICFILYVIVVNGSQILLRVLVRLQIIRNGLSAH